MNTAQRLGVGLFYAAIAALGAAYALLEHGRANWLVQFFEKLMPILLILALVIAIYRLFRMIASVLRELDGVSRAAHAVLYSNYRKK